MRYSKRYLIYLIIFLMGWFGGSFFTLMNVFTYPYISFDKISDILNPLQDRAINLIDKNLTSNTLLESVGYRQLPVRSDEYTYNASGVEQVVILDWPLDDKLFTTENYLSLESLLVLYPSALFRVLIPTSRDAYRHKVGNLLSVSHFKKYSRLGFDIEVVPVGQLEQSRGPGYGTGYWQRWMKTCCISCDAECRRTDRVQPLHLLVFLRLCRLWRRGGIASDFSLLFLKQLTGPEIEQGYFFKTTCTDRDNREAWQEEQDVTAGGMDMLPLSHDRERYFKSSRCSTSSLFVFNRPKHPAVECVLHQYDNSSFVSCVEKSEDEGVACLDETLKFCFTSLGLSNHLEISSHLVETFDELKEDDVSQIFLSREYDWRVHPQSRVIWMGDVAREGQWRKWSPSTKHMTRYNISLLEAVFLRVSQSLRALSIPLSRQDCQTSCHSFSSSPFTLPGHDSPVRPRRQSYHTGLEEASCAPGAVIAGFAQSSAALAYALLTAHPQVLPAFGPSAPPDLSKRSSCYRTNAGDRSILLRPWCYPYINPEIDSAPTHIMNSSIAKSTHTANRRVGFISVDKDVQYALDFQAPLIMRADNPEMKIMFVIRNPIERMIYHYLEFLKQFPNLSFDALVDLGLAKGGKFGRMRSLLTSGPGPLLGVYYSRPSCEEHDTRGLDQGDTDGGDYLCRIADEMFAHSIYLPPVLHFGRVMGNENIMIINMDSFNSTLTMPLKRLDKIAHKIFAFSGLCAHKINSRYLRELNSLQIPRAVSDLLSSRVTVETIRKLALFLQPFNVELSRVIGLDLEHWNDVDALHRVYGFPYRGSINGTVGEGIRPHWFEEPGDESTTESGDDDTEKTTSGGMGVLTIAKNSILRALFPPRKEGEDGDSGFNTTIGMMAMF